jgi:hypothetical protein
MYLPSRIYFIKVEQINGDRWASSGINSLRAVRRFLKRKRREYGDIKIVSFYRQEERFVEDN